MLQLSEKLRTEADAYKFLEQLRCGNKPVCPHCFSGDPDFLNPENGEARKTRRAGSWFTASVSNAPRADGWSAPGEVIVDETHIGGKPKNRHRSDPRDLGRVPGTSLRTAVVSLFHRETGEVRSKVVTNVGGENLRAATQRRVPPLRNEIHTRRAWLSHQSPTSARALESIDTQAGEYVRGNATTNPVENYFPQLKGVNRRDAPPRQRPASAPLPVAV